MEKIPNTARTKVRRQPDQGRYDRATIDAILDAGLVCQVGIVEDGLPVVIPMLYARDGERIILHGSTASRLTKSLAAGLDVCVNVTLLDGLVLARSAFNASMNYRSVVLFGTATAIEDPEQKTQAMRLFSEHVMPGRWAEIRSPSAIELAATRVLQMPIGEAVAKVRTGPPKDNVEDLELPVWAGVVPLALRRGEIESDTPDREIPAYVVRDARFGR
ncbi:MAG TPA: pyridoxamine 5'-phosphate oxidase family protein [Candidatus Acidoferrales bacterium]|nr:pyridoxamine 5'-phosphate oxidase family protein [Candidatus Acidoferrales bacterium]